MTNKKNNSQNEIDIFLRAMQGIKPINKKKNRIEKTYEAKRSVKTPTFDDHDDQIIDPFHDLPITPVTAEGFLSYKQACLPDKTLRKLRKGQYNVEAVLDLHGMKVDEAREAVLTFTKEAIARNIRIVLIIHGKGRHNPLPVLKNKLNQWLRQMKTVLAFCSATIAHGSHGSVYVLLKQSKEEK